ncbi:hypothetical protein IFR05_015813 [Cadophora sp. M221]|nr:hypothetical protein IFR05_015813 [Cadophora sp. M221]
MDRGVPLYLSEYGGTVEEGTAAMTVYFNILWSTPEFDFEPVKSTWPPEDWAYPPVPGTTCDPISTPISPKATFASGNTSYNLFQQSDFLAYDTDNTQPSMIFSLTPEGTLKASTPGSANCFFAYVHSNDNSLVYMFPAGRTTGTWAAYSYLNFSTANGDLIAAPLQNQVSMLVAQRTISEVGQVSLLVVRW